MEDNKRTLTFVDIDDWNRPIFKDHNNNYYGNYDRLFDLGTSGVEVLKTIDETMIYYFGDHFGCEPLGTKIDANKIELKP